MKTPTARLVLPEGVTAGAAIGAGGRNVRAIGRRHNVRCLVNPPQREIQFLGHQTNVAKAIADFRDVFAQILATCAELVKPPPVNAAGELFIHVRAVAKAHDAWKFERRDPAALKVDIHTQHYDYRLVPASTETVESEEWKLSPTTVESPLLYEFNGSFRERMKKEVMTLCLEKPDRHARFKAALGATCFALRDERLGTQTLSWSQLQGLQQVDQIQSRWSSVWDTSSPSIAPVLACLVDTAAQQHARIKTTMSVYVGTANAKNVEDVVVKYRYENYKWIPSTKLRPRRVLLAQYDIAAEGDRSFRIRAYTHESNDPTDENASLIDHLEVVKPTVGSYFLTTVAACSTMPTNRFVRGCTVKDKLQVDWQGLRFVVSYMNKRRTRVRIECTLLGSKEQTQDSTRAEEMLMLMDKVIQTMKPRDV